MLVTRLFMLAYCVIHLPSSQYGTKQQMFPCGNEIELSVEKSWKAFLKNCTYTKDEAKASINMCSWPAMRLDVRDYIIATKLASDSARIFTVESCISSYCRIRRGELVFRVRRLRATCSWCPLHIHFSVILKLCLPFYNSATNGKKIIHITLNSREPFRRGDLYK